MRVLSRLILRDLRRAWRGGAWLPGGFVLLIATVFPFVIGPDSDLLARTGGGILWTGSALAILLPIDRLIAPDLEHGVIDQLRLRGQSLEAVAITKGFALWLALAPVLILAAIPASALLALSPSHIARVVLVLLIGLPALAALALFVACLTAQLVRAQALAGLVLLPLATPILIFGAGAINGESGALLLLGATALFICALTPFAAAAALRIASE
ncbi:MAG: heme exporter protein CcmB [Alphaproteobacteria bacterium]|nr:heme exporter protein CcmB [Alphaproteobacteria bacterium]MDE2340432.1 heme exporter protein CcmB [Alphaproteobacteria bacterium]